MISSVRLDGTNTCMTIVDEAKNYHDADSFGRDDLLVVAKLADQAHTFIFERLNGQKSDAPSE